MECTMLVNVLHCVIVIQLYVSHVQPFLKFYILEHFYAGVLVFVCYTCMTGIRCDSRL